MSYKSGVLVDKKFNAIEFAPIYLSHLATLATIYNAEEAQGQLVNHLQRVADELRYASHQHSQIILTHFLLGDHIWHSSDQMLSNPFGRDFPRPLLLHDIVPETWVHPMRHPLAMIQVR
jgi:hypothetical protein